jgi:DNA-binding transcriptional regulator YdaS (Cro superfamily)
MSQHDEVPLPEPAAARAIRILGGPVRAAQRLGVDRYQTVQSWVRNRVPAEYCPLIERETGRQVRCEELRPDIAWDVLRGQVEPDPEPEPNGA